jgi:hypothetical protein
VSDSTTSFLPLLSLPCVPDTEGIDLGQDASLERDGLAYTNRASSPAGELEEAAVLCANVKECAPISGLLQMLHLLTGAFPETAFSSGCPGKQLPLLQALLSFEGDELEEGQSTEKEVAVPPEYT